MFRNIAAAALVAVSLNNSAHAVTIVNGDFEGGNTGFASGYTYVSPAAGALVPEAVYTVDGNAQTSHSSFFAYGDHTSGAGDFLIVNGAGTPNTVVWSQTVSVTPGQSYDFAAFLSSTFPGSPAQLDFRVTPDVGAAFTIGEFAAPLAAAVWEGVSARFNTGLASSLTLSIVNQNTTLGGNDFGIDDITLTAVPEPATWGLMIFGFGLVGAMARRRQRDIVAA